VHCCRGRQNLVRGRGLFCRSIMKSQLAAPSQSPIFAALVAVVNTKFPEIGELLLNRLVLQYKRAYKRNDKPICLAASKFIAHLVNQQVRMEVCLSVHLLYVHPTCTSLATGLSVCLPTCHCVCLPACLALCLCLLKQNTSEAYRNVV
jgi:hypothetical protein